MKLIPFKRRVTPSRIGRPGIPVRTESLSIKNTSREEFRSRMLEIPLFGYQVETLKDGRKIFISKPGGKGPDDFMVWIHEGLTGQHWRPSHSGIKKDLSEKLLADKAEGIRVIDALERVYEGVDLEDILSENPKLGRNLPGLAVDLILKAYKWIWVQEDSNYPPPNKGRAMSMDGIRDLKT